MVVGVLRITLGIEGARSLKEKRKSLRKVIDRVRARFTVSIAEVGDNELWNRAQIGVAVVSNASDHVNSILDHVLNTIYQVAEVEVLDSELEIIPIGQMV